MKSVRIYGSVVATVASFFILGYGVTTPVHAQQAALAANPELANPELAAKGVWNPNTTYANEDIVTARGSTWISLKAGNKGRVPGQTTPSSAKWWQLFARGFNPLGAWSNTTMYQPDDLVTFNGQTFRAKLTKRASQPAANQFWELLAQKGASGADGAQGPQGIQGIQGPPGPNTGISGGTQGAPAISFNGDANTGIYSPEAGKIAMVEGGILFLHNIGTSNTALGVGALFSGGAGGNTAVGDNALSGFNSGSDNTAVGAHVLFLNESGSSNTAVGHSALFNNTSGAGNSAVGVSALGLNTTGKNNTGIGNLALGSNTVGEDNIAVGVEALASNTTGYGNTAIGRHALFSNVDGATNTAVGVNALWQATGFNNVAIGMDAGSSLTSGNENIAIGNAGTGADTGVIRIGFTQTATFIAGIIGAETGAPGIPVLVDGNGQLGTVSSSRRYKYDIAAMPEMSEMLAKLRPVTFRYKQAQNDGTHPLQYGLIAEEVAEVFPDLALFNKDGSVETVKYHLLPSFLLAGYQAQQTTIAAQAQRIEALESRLQRLEALLPNTKAAALP